MNVDYKTKTFEITSSQPCTIKNLTQGTYEKFLKIDDGEYIVIWEYKTILRPFALQ
jgi:hypothetical protein